MKLSSIASRSRTKVTAVVVPMSRQGNGETTGNSGRSVKVQASVTIANPRRTRRMDSADTSPRSA